MFIIKVPDHPYPLQAIVLWDLLHLPYIFGLMCHFCITFFSSPMMAEKEEKKIQKDEGDLFSREVDRDEDGRKKNSVEIIHVRSKNCPEDQCSQQ